MKQKIALLLVLGVLGLWPSGVMATHAEDADAALLARGKALFEAKCANCHGVTGEGRGPASHYLNPKPRNLTTGIFKLKSTPEGSIPTDEDLFHTLSHGIPGTNMPSWAHLSPQARRALVAYVKSLSERFHDEEPEDVLEVGPEPAMDATSILAGRRMYERLQCAQCHGTTGGGDGAGAQDLKDWWGEPVRPRDFTKGPAHMRTGGEARDLYRAVMLGMEGTPMPAWGPLLTEQDAWDLVHYILSLREPRKAGDPVTYRPLEIPTIPSAVERGRQYFEHFGCMACHGAGGQGGKPNPNAATAEEIPGLEYVAEGYTVKELAERIQKGQPEIASKDPRRPQPPIYMPAWGQVFTEEQVSDITAYLLSLLPEGEGEEW